jgi:anti-anti-sigma regulatory factor
MAIRITRLERPAGVALRVDGWLTRADVPELLTVIEGTGEPITLDLSELRSADRSGVSVLRGLVDGGVVLESVSPVIESLIDSRRFSTRSSDVERHGGKP